MFDNADPLAITTFNMLTGNSVDETLVMAGFTVDMNGNESPDGDAPIREDWVFVAESMSKVADHVFEMQGTLGIESNPAQLLYRAGDAAASQMSTLLHSQDSQ